MRLIKSQEEIALMAEAGRILAIALDRVEGAVRVGMTAEALDELARATIIEQGGEPAFLNYKPHAAAHPYPCSLCLSINDVVVHGLPRGRTITDGDVVKIDLGVTYKGWYADSARTIAVGRVSKEAHELIAVTKEALRIGIEAAQVGNTTGDIGHAIQIYVEEHGMSIVKELTGHGIGKKLHEQPTVYNEGKPGSGIELQEGMVIAIEPMVSMGSGKIKRLPDDSYAMADGSLSAHWEHTVAITKSGPVILTKAS